MTDKTKKLTVSSDQLELIARALETQTKILRMQAGAGAQGTYERLNETKRVLAIVADQRENQCVNRDAARPWAGFMRFMGQAT